MVGAIVASGDLEGLTPTRLYLFSVSCQSKASGASRKAKRSIWRATAP
jgi:hypothetical protein